MILPVILSGGAGSRLWPLSRESHPKPFIELNDGESLLQKTYIRACKIADFNTILTVTNRDLFFYTKDEFEDANNSVEENVFVLEPIGRNSTAAIAAAAIQAVNQYGGECILLVMPADHLIEDEKAFIKAVGEAKDLASSGKLVTFGIKPSRPETGFGYILADGNDVLKFVEKPNKETAEEYINSGNYFWNSGIFCMRADSFLAELSLLSPDINEGVKEALAHAKHSYGDTWQQFEIQQKDFESVASISVDYAVFEKSQNVSIVPCDIGWSDIGSWNELGGLNPTDENQNHIFGNAICKQTYDCIIHGSDRLIATVGVKDIIIADTADAVLIAHKDCAQDVRSIVDELKSRNDAVYREFPTIHRPWGTYTVLQEGSGYKLKRIEVKIGAQLSMQSHKHRSEHWVVVSGRAAVINNDERIELEANQSTYIPIGHKHYLQNMGNEKLILIEVQCGEYLGEDDIKHFDLAGKEA